MIYYKHRVLKVIATDVGYADYIPLVALKYVRFRSPLDSGLA